MDTSERDVIPMLSAAYPLAAGNDGSTRGLSTSTRSASISIPMTSLDSSEDRHNLVGFTGPLRNERRTAFIQMSGPLYANRNGEFIFRPPQTSLWQRSKEPIIERYGSSIDKTDNDTWPSVYTGQNEHLSRSGQLGMCNDPYCTTCPMNSNFSVKGHLKPSTSSDIFNEKFQKLLYGDAKGWPKRIYSYLLSYMPAVMNPHAKVIQRWNKFFVISCLFAVFMDPLFFFLLYVEKDNKCLVLNQPMTTTIIILRSMTDFIYLMHILLQFRLAYVAPESKVVGAGDLVSDPGKIAWNYLSTYFILDFFVVLPLPQIIILLFLPHSMEGQGANNAKNILRVAILVQYIPRLCRFMPLVGGASPRQFIFESAWANFVINLLNFVLASHVVGSCWYLLGLQRVNQCFRNACNASNITKECMDFIDCGHGNDYSGFEIRTWELWKSNENATACFRQDGYFDFGIYQKAVNLTTHKSLLTRYIYSLFWGFQQISTLAGNQVPSYFEWEVLFTMSIIGIGLLLFALLIGNMQNFLQALGRRRLEMSLRRRDAEQWMRHRRLPDELRRRVRESERFNWVATRGLNEEMLMENLPEDLQREIRCHLFMFVKKVRFFQLLDEPVMDAICERLRAKTYIEDSTIFYRGGLVDKIVFIIRGKIVSIGEDENVVSLSEGDVCGEELLTGCLEDSSASKGKKMRVMVLHEILNSDSSSDRRADLVTKLMSRIRHLEEANPPQRNYEGQRLISNRLVKCLTKVQAFVLRAADLEEVTSQFARFLKSPRVQGAIRYLSPYWRERGATGIQVAWRYRKKRMARAASSRATPN